MGPRRIRRRRGGRELNAEIENPHVEPGLEVEENGNFDEGDGLQLQNYGDPPLEPGLHDEQGDLFDGVGLEVDQRQESGGDGPTDGSNGFQQEIPPSLVNN